MKALKVSKDARSIETICTVAIDNDYRHAKVEVTRYVWDQIKLEWKTVQRVYKVHWYNVGLVALRDWAGAQSFGAKRGLIDIRQNSYINHVTPAVYYNIHRLKRRETKNQF